MHFRSTHRGALGLPATGDVAPRKATRGKHHWFVRTAQTIIAIDAFLCLISLVNWYQHRMESLLLQPGPWAIRPSAALAMLAISLSLWLKRRPAKRSRVSDLASAFAVLLGLLALLEMHSVHVPMLRFGKAASMTATTATAVVLLGGSLLLLDRGRGWGVAMLGGCGALSIGSAISFVYGAAPSLGFGQFHIIHIGTALLLLSLCVATLCIRSELEPLRSLTSPALHENRARRFMLMALLLPPFLGLILLRGVTHDLFDVRLCLTLLVTLLLILQSILVWRSADTLSRFAHVSHKAQDALRRNEKLAAVGRLAATIAHEINNPLGSVNNLIYLSQHSASIEEARPYLELAEQEMQRVSQITAQTLSFYREGSQASDVNLQEVVESAVFLLRSRITSSGVDVHSRFAEHLPLVHCSSGEIRQVLINLIANALDATPRRGKIEIRVAPERLGPSRTPAVRVTIGDTGSGITRANRSKLFEPFFTTKEATGNGLGLWVASGIVERHGGQLRIWSSTLPGRSGTVCALHLPSLPPPESPASLEPANVRDAKMVVPG